MADWVRDKAMMSMTSSLGADVLIPTRLTAQEAISEPFSFEITAISQKGVIDANDILNQAVCVTLRDADGPVRYFHGFVHEVRRGGAVRGKTGGEEFESYNLVVMPRLWFLNQTQDCRVYQNKSAKAILTEMFQDIQLTDFNFAVGASPTRPYTVQFNESDYSFAVRLMEEEGWFFYFEHSESKHTLVVTDKNATFKDIPDTTLHFTTNELELDGILEWKPPIRTTTGSYAKADYDPEKPGTKLYSQQKTVLKAGGADSRDVFRWPALTNTGSVVEARARFEIEAAEAAVSLCHGVSFAGKLVPGGKFRLSNSPASPDDASYALKSVHHVIEDTSWLAGDGSVSYRNRFEAFKSSVPWRQPLATPRPRMDGVHSALVMGPQSSAGGQIKMQQGEEIHTDDLARVKVRFFWDWRAEATGGASIWARVIQPWAGNGWGAQFTPRVGTEVAVAFVDGDPDRPIVIGGLYNGSAAPIYLAADKTKSGFRSRSTLKGDTSKFNELTFDDKSGSELIFIHAEKNMTTEVENDEKLTVDNCRIVLVKADESITVKGKQTTKITKDHLLQVTDGNHDVKIDMGNQTTKIGMGNYDLKVAMGNVGTKADLGAITMEAMQSITLKVGQSSVTIDQMGVTVKGMMVKVEGQISTDIKGLMTTLKGEAMVMVKGAITMIN